MAAARDAADADIANIVHEVDGEYYVAGSQGEQEDDVDFRKVLIPNAYPNVYQLNRRTDVAANNAALLATAKLNYWWLVAKTAGETFKTVITPVMICKIVFVRLLALITGLFAPGVPPADHNVRYNECIVVRPGFQVRIAEANQDLDANIPGWNAPDMRNWRDTFKKKFYNVVCAIAFQFRTRGHHWLADMEDRYVNVWRKSLYEEDQPGLAWEHLAITALHAIMPDVLDQFWQECCVNELCSGALIKRWNSFSAGTAIIGAVRAGITDIVILFPRLMEYFKPAMEHINACLRAVGESRWIGSINRRYYGARNMSIDEVALSSAAAIILAASNMTGIESPLKNSPALQRVARNAPITGMFMSQILQKAVQHDRMVDTVLPVEGEEAD